MVRLLLEEASSSSSAVSAEDVRPPSNHSSTTSASCAIRNRSPSLSRVAVGKILLFCCAWSGGVIVDAAIPCSDTKECTTRLPLKTAGNKNIPRLVQSECIDGFCSNPFRTGCLRSMGVKVDFDNTGQLVASKVMAEDRSDADAADDLLQHLPKRSCNSDDLLVDDGDCDMTQQDQFPYPPVRIHNGNWESSIFLAWIFQILLMEVLGAPVTVGLTTETTTASSFYSPTNTLEYSSAAYPFHALQEGTQCHQYNDNRDCAQVLPEVWNGQLNEWTKAANEGIIEPIEGNGQVGKGSWYVPKFTAERDDSLVSVYGLSGEENRHKLAEAFLKPTTWLDYCQLVSTNNCSTPDATALHFPTEQQQGKYFTAGSYQGYFRRTPANNCTAFPDSCLGHIVGPGCTWSTNVDGQLYWNDIKLTPDGPLQPNGGYEYSSMLEIWRAADATNSNVVFWWWRPEALIEEFHGTDSQFQMILLPEATDACSRARVGTEDRCSEDIMVRRGDPEGACDQEAHALQKVLSQSFREQTTNQQLVEKSPSYDLIKAVKITDLQINHMLRRWIELGVDPYGNDAREAVCGWVVENIDSLLDFVPAGYPKQLDSEQTSYESGLHYTAIALGIVCALVVLVMARMAYYWRQTKVFVYAQAHIVYLITVGFFLITLGAIFVAMEPSSPVCGAQIWLVNLGYSIELVPLLVKIAAINKIISAASKLRRVKISRNEMFKQVGFIVGIIAAFLLVWTIVDPPQAVEKRVLPDRQEPLTVETSLTCASDKGFWTVTALAWQGMLLLIATVLAFQSRDVAQAFNESQKLGTMIYSHMLFLVLRIVVYLLGDRETFQPNIIAGISSILLSLDTLFATFIYLFPKYLEARKKVDDTSPFTFGGGTSAASAAVSVIERNAALAYNSYTSHTSMVDSSGTPSMIRRSGSSSFRSPQDSVGNLNSNNAPGDFPLSSPLTSGRGGGSLLRNRLTKGLSGLPEVSREESENEFSGPLQSEHEDSPLKQNNNRSSRRLSAESKNSNNRSSRRLSAEKETGSSRRLSAESKGSNRRLSAESLGSTRRLSTDDMSIHFEPDGLVVQHSTHSHEPTTNEDDDDYSSDSVDSGGPRFTNPKANEDLERSVQALDFALEDDEDISSNGRGHHTFSHFGYNHNDLNNNNNNSSSVGRISMSLDILPEYDDDEEFESNRTEAFGSNRDGGNASA